MHSWNRIPPTARKTDADAPTLEQEINSRVEAYLHDLQRKIADAPTTVAGENNETDEKEQITPSASSQQ